MLFFFKFFFIFLISMSLQSNQDYYLNAFKETLLEFNITFDNLGNHKAGAICIPTDSQSIMINML